MAYSKRERRSVCIICNEPFIAARRGPVAKICYKRECQYRYYLERRKKTGIRCSVCGNPVYAKNLCKRHYEFLRKYGDTSDYSSGSCSVCGRKIQIPRTTARPIQTCGDPQCRSENTERKRRLLYAKKRGVVMGVCQNPVCGIEFERPNKPGHPSACCSEDCRKELTILRAQNNRLIRERAVEDGEFDITLTEIYRRDDGICFLCGLDVERIDASIDHIDALSKGGKHRRDRVALAHRRCNSRKNARTLEEYIALYPRKRAIPSTHVLAKLAKS